MENDVCYIVNKEYVVHELMDAELTVINLQKGFYYIGKDSAIDIFFMLDKPVSIDDMVGRTMAIYAAPEETVRQEVESLIEMWLSNDLVSQTGSGPDASRPTSTAESELKPWTKPLFIAFDDMRDLLLLDPIHETELDEQGWPVAASPHAR